MWSISKEGPESVCDHCSCVQSVKGQDLLFYILIHYHERVGVRVVRSLHHDTCTTENDCGMSHTYRKLLWFIIEFHGINIGKTYIGRSRSQLVYAVSSYFVHREQNISISMTRQPNANIRGNCIYCGGLQDAMKDNGICPAPFLGLHNWNSYTVNMQKKSFFFLFANGYNLQYCLTSYKHIGII